VIDENVLHEWLDILRRGERVHIPRTHQRDLIEELLTHRKQVTAFNEQMRLMQVENKALHETLSIYSKRGDRTNGMTPPIRYEGAVTGHGHVSPWPEEWGVQGVECDAGGCSKIAALARYDAHGHGWLPVCEECSKKTW
jgi:hypothetical protein